MTTTQALLGFKASLGIIWDRSLDSALCSRRLGELNLTAKLLGFKQVTDFISALGCFRFWSNILINICIIVMQMSNIWDGLWWFALGRLFLSLKSSFFLVLAQGWRSVLVKWWAFVWIIHWTILDSIQIWRRLFFSLFDVFDHAFLYFPASQIIKAFLPRIFMFRRPNF